jgi:hypothetical protein
MQKLLKKTKLVKQILQEVPQTRCDDGRLLLEYYRRIGVDISMSFIYLMATKQIKDIPTIVRTRAKIQEQFPDLRDEKVWEERHSRQEPYVDYAVNANKNVIENIK